MDPTRRALGIAAAALAIPPGGTPVTASPAAAADPRSLADLEAEIHTAALRYDTVPCRATRETATALAAIAARGAAGTGKNGPWRGWLRARARALILVAQAQNHEGHAFDAARTLRLARAAAEPCGDGVTMAHVWALTARMADRDGRPYEAIRHAQHARSLAPGTPMALLLSVKTEGGAWSAVGRADMVGSCISTAMTIQRRLGEADHAPRGYSLLDEGLHPADVALSALGALAAVGQTGGLVDALAAQVRDTPAEGAHIAGTNIALARDAINRGAHDEAAELVVEAVDAVPDGRSWLAGEVLTVGGMIQEPSEGLGLAMHHAAAWMGHGA